MASKRTICVVSGGRADYGLLKPVMNAIKDSNDFLLQVVVTGSHLSSEYGNTWKVVEADGFHINSKIEILSDGDAALDTAIAMARALEGAARVLSELKPDLVLVLGDRYEILAVVNASLILRLPVAHLCGGDVTEGAFDESIRHSITKCSHLHFATNEQSAGRIKQMGENPDYVFNVGSSGLDNIVDKQDWVTRQEWQESIGLGQYDKNILITFHPATLDSQSSLVQFHEIVSALSLFNDTGLIITGTNSDTEGRQLMDAAKEFAGRMPNAVFLVSLGMERYLNTMHYVDVVVGNSSSGLYEAPSFNVPTVNIGSRQEGRLQASSVINCAANSSEIKHSIQQALNLKLTNVVNPYGDGKTAPRIVSALSSIDDFSLLLKKPFFEL